MVADDILKGCHIMLKKYIVVILATMILALECAPAVFSQELNNPPGQTGKALMGYLNIFANKAFGGNMGDSRLWFTADGQCIVDGNGYRLSTTIDKGLICSMPAADDESASYSNDRRADSGFVVGLTYSFKSLQFHDLISSRSFFITGFSKTPSGSVPSVSINFDIH
jgi:hypothetical protein